MDSFFALIPILSNTSLIVLFVLTLDVLHPLCHASDTRASLAWPGSSLGDQISWYLYSVYFCFIYRHSCKVGRYSCPVTEMRPLRPERGGHLPEDAQHRRGSNEILSSISGLTPSPSPPEFSPCKAGPGWRVSLHSEGSCSKLALVHSQPRVPQTIRNPELSAQHPSIL